MPTLQQFLDDKETVWTRLTVAWHDHQQRDIDIVSATSVWFHNSLPAVPIRYALIRDVAGEFEPQALLSTDLMLCPEDILAFFMRSWQMETTFHHVREHLGVETQRQWSDKAILRTTSVLLGLFSVVTLCADSLISRHGFTSRTAAWYPKTLPTFADAVALVRHGLWAQQTFQMSADDVEMVKGPHPLLERFNDLLAYAACGSKSS